MYGTEATVDIRAKAPSVKALRSEIQTFDVAEVALKWLSSASDVSSTIRR